MQNEQTPAAGASLLPCPFCGGIKIKDRTCRHARDPSGDFDMIGCTECGVGIIEGTPDDWNRRPHIPSPASSSSVVQGDASGVEREVDPVVKALTVWAESGQPDDAPIYSDRHDEAAREIAESGGVTSISDPDYTIGDVRRFLFALHPQPSGERLESRCQRCGGEIQGWLCQSCPAEFRENDDGYLIFDDETTPVSRPAGEGEREAVALTVWYGSMPESNGKANWTATLGRKGDPTFDLHGDGFCFARSEYPERVRYEADRMRWVIGEVSEQPDILAYDEKAHSGYVAPLLSPAAPDAGGGWMPIETAPKDGTKFIGLLKSGRATTVSCRKHHNGFVRKPDGGWVPNGILDDVWCEEEASAIVPRTPTHWMPLPAPPALQPGGER